MKLKNRVILLIFLLGGCGRVSTPVPITLHMSEPSSQVNSTLPFGTSAALSTCPVQLYRVYFDPINNQGTPTYIDVSGGTFDPVTHNAEGILSGQTVVDGPGSITTSIVPGSYRISMIIVFAVDDNNPSNCSPSATGQNHAHILSGHLDTVSISGPQSIALAAVMSDTSLGPLYGAASLTGTDLVTVTFQFNDLTTFMAKCQNNYATGQIKIELGEGGTLTSPNPGSFTLDANLPTLVLGPLPPRRNIKITIISSKAGVVLKTVSYTFTTDSVSNTITLEGASNYLGC